MERPLDRAQKAKEKRVKIAHETQPKTAQFAQHTKAKKEMQEIQAGASP